MKSRRPYILLFAALTIIYHSNLRPVASGDSLPASLVPFSLLFDQRINLDRSGPWLRAHVPYASWVLVTSGGHYYSYTPVAGAVLASPLYLPILLVPNLRHWDPASLVALARILEKFTAVTVAALTALVMLALLKRITSLPWAWGLTLVYALATDAWSISSQALWQHTTGQLVIACALLFLDHWSADRRSRWLWLSGLSIGWAMLIRPSNSLFFAAAVAGLLISRASIADVLGFSVLPLGGGLLALTYNLHVFGNSQGTYSITMLNGDFWQGLLGILASPGKGLFIYTPISLFTICAFLRPAAAVRTKHAAICWASAIFAVLQVLLVSRIYGWWGGYCWTARYLSEIVPPLIVLIAIGTPLLAQPWIKRAFVVLTIYSIFIQAVGVYFYPKGHWDDTPVSVDEHPERLWDWRDNPIRRTVEAGPAWEPYAIVAAAITGGTSAAARKMHELHINPY